MADVVLIVAAVDVVVVDVSFNVKLLEKESAEKSGGLWIPSGAPDRDIG